MSIAERMSAQFEPNYFKISKKSPLKISKSPVNLLADSDDDSEYYFHISNPDITDDLETSNSAHRKMCDIMEDTKTTNESGREPWSDYDTDDTLQSLEIDKISSSKLPMGETRDLGETANCPSPELPVRVSMGQIPQVKPPVKPIKNVNYVVTGEIQKKYFFKENASNLVFRLRGNPSNRKLRGKIG